MPSYTHTYIHEHTHTHIIYIYLYVRTHLIVERPGGRHPVRNQPLVGPDVVGDGLVALRCVVFCGGAVCVMWRGICAAGAAVESTRTARARLPSLIPTKKKSKKTTTPPPHPQTNANTNAPTYLVDHRVPVVLGGVLVEVLKHLVPRGGEVARVDEVAPAPAGAGGDVPVY